MAELRKRGLKTLVICSTAFERLGRSQARAFGVPDLALVIITHPLGGIGRDEVRARADQALSHVIDVLRGHAT